MKDYNTVLNEARVEQVEKKSRFICSIKPVANEDEALDFIKTISEKYKDANHNVFAYVIRNGVQIQRANDDGEPQGTAGVPILEVIKREGLSNVCIVVTRYFGGILLGAAGLIRAYSSTAKAGIIGAKKCKMSVFNRLVIKIDYTYLGKVQNSIVSMGHNIINIEYSEFVKLYVKIKSENLDNTINTINELTYGDAVTELSEKYYDVLEVI